MILTKENKIKRKQYLKMMKNHKKNIMRCAKSAAVNPFDYEFGVDMFITYLEFMRDYYKLGWNVYAKEPENGLSRLEGIENALSEYKLAYDKDNCLLKKYFNYNIPSGLHSEKRLIDGKETSVLVFDINFGAALNGLTMEQATEQYNAEKLAHKKNFYDLLLWELESWWD